MTSKTKSLKTFSTHGRADQNPQGEKIIKCAFFRFERLETRSVYCLRLDQWVSWKYCESCRAEKTVTTNNLYCNYVTTIPTNSNITNANATSKSSFLEGDF